MNIDLPQEQRAFIHSLVDSGRFSSADEVIGEGIRLLVAQEQLRQQVEIGIEEADRGNLVDHDTVFAYLKSLATAAQHRSR